jgi:hypothetical protein
MITKKLSLSLLMLCCSFLVAQSVLAVQDDVSCRPNFPGCECLDDGGCIGPYDPTPCIPIDIS